MISSQARCSASSAVLVRSRQSLSARSSWPPASAILERGDRGRGGPPAAGRAGFVQPLQRREPGAAVLAGSSCAVRAARRGGSRSAAGRAHSAHARRPRHRGGAAGRPTRPFRPRCCARHWRPVPPPARRPAPGRHGAVSSRWHGRGAIRRRNGRSSAAHRPAAPAPISRTEDGRPGFSSRASRRSRSTGWVSSTSLTLRSAGTQRGAREVRRHRRAQLRCHGRRRGRPGSARRPRAPSAPARRSRHTRRS